MLKSEGYGVISETGNMKVLQEDLQPCCDKKIQRIARRHPILPKKNWRAHLEDVTMDKQELYQHLFFDEEMQLISGRCPV